MSGKRVGRKSSALVAAQNRVRGRPTLESIGIARESLPAKDFGRFIDWLLSQPSLQKLVFGEPLPRRPHDLKWRPSLSPIDVSRELRWAECYLSRFQDVLSKHVRLRAELQEATLRGDIDSVNRVRIEIRAQLGISVWLFNSELGVLAVLAGEDRAERERRILAASFGQGDAMRFVIDHRFLRATGRISEERLLVRLDEAFRSSGIPQPEARFLRFLVLDEDSIAEQDFGITLRFAAGLSVVDYYEIVIRALAAAVGGLVGAQAEAVGRAIDALNSSVPDPRLDHAVALLRSGISSGRAPEATDVAVIRSKILSGDTAGAMSTVEAPASGPGLSLDRVVLLGILSAARDLQPANKAADGSYGQLIAAIARVVSREDGAAEARLELQRFAMHLDGFCVGPSLRLVLDFMNGPRVFLDDLTSYRKNAILAGGTGVLTAALPMRSQLVSLRISEDAKAEPNLAGASKSALLEAACNLAREDYDAALERASTVRSSTCKADRIEGLRIETWAQLSRGRLRDVVDRTVRVIANEPELMRYLPLEEVALSVIESGDSSLRAEVSIPILLDIAATEIDSDFDGHCRDAIEDFMASCGVERPSQFGLEQVRAWGELGIAFLDAVCNEQRLELLAVFGSYLEVLDERRAICERLVELSAPGHERFEEEIRELVRRKVLARRRTEVEGSKIFVDKAQITRSFEASYEGLYFRYQQLVREVGVPKALDFQEKIQDAISKHVGAGTYVFVAAPEDEPAQLLRSLVAALRDEYVSNSTHGLDGYLSVRVRHGTLAGQLRRVLEDRRLIATRISATSNYLAGGHWGGQLAPNDPKTAERVERELIEFSRKFDDLLKEVLSRWVQIKRLSGEPGCFDFTVSGHALEDIAARTLDQPISDFMGIVLKMLDDRLEQSLREIRRRFDGEFKERIQELIANLQRRIAALVPRADLGNFFNRIQAAHTSLQQECDRVKAWFRRSAELRSEPFTLEEVIHVASDSFARAGRMEVLIDLRDAASVEFSGHLLPSLYDIFSMLLDNVMRHSGMETSTTKFTGDISDSRLMLEVGSPLSGAEGINALEARIAGIKKQLQVEESRELVRREGGSGLVKIANILRRDFGHAAVLDFFVDGEGQFVVHIEVDLAASGRGGETRGKS